MSFGDIEHALSDNLVVDQDGNGLPESKFDFVNFDACLMGSVDMAIAFADYADYYICSADYVPGYGEYYTGWLNKLGEQPDYPTFELGKIIVDSFYDFYTNSDYAGQDGTLAVIDLNKLTATETGFLDAVNELGSLLKAQAESFGDDGSMRIYDEFLAARNSIQYGINNYYDLAQFASLLGIVASEVSEANLHDGSFDSTNVYTEVSQKFKKLLSQDGGNDLIYSKVTKHEKSGNVIYRTEDGGFAYGELPSCGLYIYFPVPGPDIVFVYNRAVSEATEYMKPGIGKTVLANYVNSLPDYGIAYDTAFTIKKLINNDGVDKSEITFDKILEHWNKSLFEEPELADYTEWSITYHDHFAQRPGSLTENGELTEDCKAWLTRVVEAQVKDTIVTDNITANRVITNSGDAYRITVSDAQKRVVQSVERNIYAELPAVEAYKKLVDEELSEDIERFGKLRIGKVYGKLSWPMPYPTDLTDLDYLKKVVSWYNKPESTWDVPDFEQKWYAVTDAEGSNHAASIYSINDNSIIIPAYYGDSVTDQHPIYLKFEKENPDDTFGKLIVVFFVQDDGAIRGTMAENLTGELNVWTMVSGSHFMGETMYIPITENAFTVNKNNYNDISISFTDIANISDIRDVDGDSLALDSTVTITDTYGLETDVTNQIVNPEFDVYDISLADVNSAVAIGDELKLDITLYGEPLEEGTDYTWEKKNLSDDLTVPGEYEITLIGHSRFTNRAVKTITVKTGLAGDVNLDGKIDILDASDIQKYLVEKVSLSEPQKYIADVNNDGEVDILDATMIQKYTVGKITEFPKR